MSHFEYILTGELDSNLEEKTDLFIKSIYHNNAPYYLIKYYDTVINEDKKERTFILTSSINLKDYIMYNFFNNCNMNVVVYFKHRVY
jgi:hypothetical protein